MSDKLPSTIVLDDEQSYGVNTIFDEYMKWHERYDEFAQGRTNFQIEQFIGLEDGTPAHNYVNILYQTRVMRGEFMREIKRGVEMERNFDYRWKTHLQTHGPDVPLEIKDQNGNIRCIWYDLEKFEHDHALLELKMSVKDKVQQLQTFDEVLLKLEEMNGGKFTKKQYDDEAPSYWMNRFLRQSVDDLISSRLGISTGDAKVIRQALAPAIRTGKTYDAEERQFLEGLINGEYDPIQAIQKGNEHIKEIYQKMTHDGFLENKTEQKIKLEDLMPKEDYDPYKLSQDMLDKLK